MSDGFLVRVPNWVGDVCMALPALRTLADAGLDLHLVGKRWAGDLLSGHGWRFTALPKDLRGSLAAVRATGCHSGLLLTNSIGSALRLRLAGVHCLGHGGWRSPLLARAIPRAPAQGLHEAEVFHRLACAALVWQGRQHQIEMPATLGLRPAERHQAQATAALHHAGIERPFLVIAPLAIGKIKGRSKVWPTFTLLCRLLSEAGWILVTCPGPGEEAATSATTPSAIALPGLDLGTYAAVCARASAVIANDSGPMHLAAAVGTPVVGIFGVGDPQRTRPWSPTGIAVGSARGWPSVPDVLETVLSVCGSNQPGGR